MKETSHYRLQMPEAQDPFNIRDLNQNTETIDSIMHELQSGVDGMADQIQSIIEHDFEGEGGFNFLLPPAIPVAVGQTYEFYFNTVLAGRDRNYSVSMTGNYGKTYARKWSFSPTADQVGNRTMNLQIHRDGKLVFQRNIVFSVSVRNEVQPPKLPMMFIGDSLSRNFTPGMQWIESASEQDYGSNLFSFVGTEGTAPYKHEGRSGWTSQDYVTEKEDNPFWDPVNKTLSFSYYTDQSGITPAMVHLMLGTNDIYRVYPTSATISNLQAIIEQMKEDWPDTFIYISPPPLSANQDGWAEMSYSSTARVGELEPLYLSLASEISSVFGGDERVNIVPTYWGFDREYNYPTRQIDANPFISTKMTVPTDAQHPAAGGYQQIGSMIYSTWMYNHPNEGGTVNPPGEKIQVTNLFASPRFDSIADWELNPIAPVIYETDVIDGALHATITASDSLYYVQVRQTLALDLSHLYYFRASMMWEEDSTPGATVRNYRLYFGNTQLAIGETSSWNTISAVSHPESDGNNRCAMTFRIAPTAPWVGATIKLREPLLIDLTENFGAGKEPTKEWSDLNIPFFSGAIDLEL